MKLHVSVKFNAIAYIGETLAMSEVPSEAHVLAWTRLMKAGRLVLTAVEADLKAAGLPPLGWYDVLLELRRAQRPVRPVDIEASLLLAQHNVSRLLDRLVVAGLVERLPCDTDRRGQLIALSEDGSALLQRMWPVYRAAIQRHVGAKLSEADAQQAAAILDRLI
jgi:DNA-binding MarR family transcriptional regulator